MDGKEEQLDKRPWLMDALLYIGNSMAAITHIQEKKQYLLAEIETEEDTDIIQQKINEISNLNDLHDEIYDGYNSVMTHIMDLPEAKKEYRCLLKHTSTNLIIAMELADAIDGADMDEPLRKAFNGFAGAVSLALGIEFKTCIRCIYDGLKDRSEKNKSIANL